MSAGDKDQGEADSGQHQNIQRATLVLTVLAETGTQGARLVDVVRRTGLSKTAAHRCLAGLTLHGLAAFDEDNARFYLGDQIFAWSFAARGRYELAARAAPYVERLADQTEDTVYFMVRRGDEAVCFARGEGRFPIKTLTLNVGERRPLGTNTGSLAILAFLSDAEIGAIVASKAGARRSAAFSGPALQAMVADARTRGYSWIDGQVMPGMSGAGVPVRDTSGTPVAALSVAAISPRLASPRREEIVASLVNEARRMEQELGPLLG